MEDASKLLNLRRFTAVKPRQLRNSDYLRLCIHVWRSIRKCFSIISIPKNGRAPKSLTGQQLQFAPYRTLSWYIYASPKTFMRKYNLYEAKHPHFLTSASVLHAQKLLHLLLVQKIFKRRVTISRKTNVCLTGF